MAQIRSDLPYDYTLNFQGIKNKKMKIARGANTFSEEELKDIMNHPMYKNIQKKLFMIKPADNQQNLK